MDLGQRVVVGHEEKEFFLTHTFEECSDQLDAIVDRTFTPDLYEHPDDRIAGKYFVYRTFKLYEDANDRTVTGLPYENHAFLVAQLVGGDFIAKIAALGHDGPEEFFEAWLDGQSQKRAPQLYQEKEDIEERLANIQRRTATRWKSTRYRLRARLDAVHIKIRAVEKEVRREFTEQEDVLHKKYIENCREFLRDELSQMIEHARTENLITHVLCIMEKLTRREGELYYRSVDKLYELADISDDEKRNRDRAVTVKFADTLANSLEMDVQERESARGRHGTTFSHEAVVAWYKQYHQVQGLVKIQRQMDREATFAASHWKKRRHGEFTQAQKLYRMYKNIIIVNQYRFHKRGSGAISEVAKIQVLRETVHIANSILEELCVNHTYYSDPTRSRSRKHLTPEKIYALQLELEQYQREGGFTRITEPVLDERGFPQGFDGILKFFFHTRVYGSKDHLNEMYLNKEQVYRVALGLRTLAETYLADRSFALEGFETMKCEDPKTRSYGALPAVS